MFKFLSSFGSCGKYVLGISLLLLVANGYTLHAQEKSKGKTIIILDASGSMWGNVSGGVKIDIAKKVIADLLPTIDENIEIGLVAYGHRKKGDCGDIELLVPPGLGNRDAISRAVSGIIPKGKTPLCDAVMISANYLKYEENKASVILISDGIETCGKDPCAVGNQLAAQGIDFVCHVVAFDIVKDKNAGLDCLSSETGGMYLEAKDAEGLKNALNQVVESVAMKETALILSGKNSTGDLLSGVNFEIYKGKESEKPIYTGIGGKYRVVLDPGEYHLVGKFGKLRAEGVLKVPEGETTQHILSFEASGLTARAKLTEGGEAIQKSVGWRVFTDSGNGERISVTYAYSAEPTFHLAPGKYILQATYQESSAEVEVEVVESKGTDVTIVLGSGTLVAQARMSENSAPLTQGVGWRLFHAEPDGEGDLRSVTYNYDAKSTMLVTAGKYILRATHKEAATQKEVEVKGGETTEVMLTFGAGTVVGTAVMSEGGELLKKSVGWNLYTQPDADGQVKKVAYGYNAREVFKVPSGVYRLEAKQGSAVASEEIVVSAGENTERTLNLNAGIWKGEAYMSEGDTEAVVKDTAWKIWTLPDPEGNRKSIAYSYGNTNYTLPAGKYIAELKRGAAFVTKEISILPGQVTTDKIILNAGVVQLKAEGGLNPGVIVYPAKQEGGKRRSITYGYGPVQNFYLPAGNYVVDFNRTVNGEKKTSSTNITIEAGKFKKVTLE